MPDRLITHTRHVDLAVPDFARQTAFFTDLWKLTPVAQERGLAFFAAEGSPEQYVIRVRQAAEKRIDLIAYGARDRAAVDTLAARLARAGTPLVGEPAELKTPGGGYGFRFFDPDGRTVEISADVAVRAHRRIEERESVPVKLSHVVVNSADPEPLRAFYEEQLDFTMSDALWHPRMGELMWFMRCSPQHHSMAIARGPHSSLHHVSFELRGIDEFMRGTGRLMRAGVRKVWGPGRHLSGDNTFAYFMDPHGNAVEYTTELEIVDEDTYHPSLVDVSQPENQDQWGTANPFDELVVEANHNDPDRGAFIAPPV